jgi:hypothetical protein
VKVASKAAEEELEHSKEPSLWARARIDKAGIKASWRCFFEAMLAVRWKSLDTA